MLVRIIVGPGTGQVIDMVDYIARARILGGTAVPVISEPEKPSLDIVTMFERRYEQARDTFTWLRRVTRVRKD